MEVRPLALYSEENAFPSTWQLAQLQDLGQWKGGGTPSMRNSSFWEDGTIPWVSSGDMKVSRLRSTSSKITEEAVKNSSTTLLPKHSILVVTRSGILRKYLPVAISEVPLAINQDIKALIPADGVDPSYVFHQLVAKGPAILASCQKSGTTVESIETKWLKGFVIPLPPLPEQRAIAEVLSDVDALIEQLDALIAKKRAVKTATMQRLLTGKQRLPGFSEPWETRRLGAIAPLQRGYDLPTSAVDPGPFPVVYSNGVLRRHKTAMDSGPGVVTGRSGTLGKVHYIREDYWPHNTSLWVTDFCGNHPKYIYFLLGFIRLDRFGGGSGVPTLNRNVVHEHEVSVPPADEQRAIAQILSDMDAEIEALEARREKTQRLKHSMMQELLTGRTRLV